MLKKTGGKAGMVPNRKRDKETDGAASRDAFRVRLSDALRPLTDSIAIQAEATRALGEHLGASRVLYAEILDDANTAVVEADYCRDGTPSVAGRHLLCDFGPFVSETLKAGRTLMLADFGEISDLTSEERAAYGAVDIQAYISVPLVKEGRLTALLNVNQSVPRQWNEDEVALVEEVAERTWAAVERARAEESLRKSEERFRALVTASSEVLYRMSPDWSEMRQLHSRSFLANTERPNRNWLQEYIHPDDQAYVTAVIHEAIRTKSVFELEHRVRRADGSLGWTFSRAVPLMNANGEIVEWFGAASDITDRKQAETKLKDAKDAAEDASRAKSEFLANMSHEIRTPMTIFLAALEHLLQIERTSEHRHLLEMADKSARRLRALIDDILDFSRIEARRVELEEAPFDLRNCVREAVDMFALPAREKNLRIETDVSPAAPPVFVGDLSRLTQVLTNLISNAVKFTHEGEVRVSVQPRGDFLEFSVADTGIGIPEEKRHLLFESFSQADTSFHRQYGGSGLGLAISKGLVELMGGQIEVMGGKFGGSVFTFLLPFKIAERGGSKPPDLLPEDSGEAIPAVHILLAEDEPMIREVLTMVLARRGWYTDTAVSGRDAVERWQKGTFNIVLMDLQMPDMDGLEATRAIRKREAEEGRRTCIIGLTAHARSEIVNDCLQAGMNEVLTKPVRMNDLFSAIDRCLLE
jgi:signal transduction histidine kinase/ActR/RegA family two-component response regulator